MKQLQRLWPEDTTEDDKKKQIIKHVWAAIKYKAESQDEKEGKIKIPDTEGNQYKSYKRFVSLVVARAVGVQKFQEGCGNKKLKNLITLTTEAFVHLVIDNDFDKFVQLAFEDGTPKKVVGGKWTRKRKFSTAEEDDSTRTSHTEDESTARSESSSFRGLEKYGSTQKFGGWSEKGLETFDTLCRQLKVFRKEPGRIELEEKLMRDFRAEQKQKREKQVEDVVELTPCYNELDDKSDESDDEYS